MMMDGMLSKLNKSQHIQASGEKQTVKVVATTQFRKADCGRNDENKKVLLSHKSNEDSAANLLSSFFKIYFDFSYALCCSPFRFVENGNTNSFNATKSKNPNHSQKYFRLKSSSFQKVITGVVNLSGLYVMLSDTRKILPKVTRSRNPLRYFQFICKLVGIMFQMKTFHTLWFHQETFLDILNFLRENQFGFKFQGGKKLRRWISTCHLAYVICILYAIMAFTQVIWTKLVMASEVELIPFARYMFFLERDDSRRMTKEQISGMDTFLGVLTALGWIGRFINGFYTDLWLLFGVLTVWMASYTFAEKLTERKKRNESGIFRLDQFAPVKNYTTFLGPFQQERRQMGVIREQNNWVEIYGEYQVIRKLTQMVSKVYGATLTIYLAYSLLFDSISMDRIFVIKEPAEKLQTIFFFSANLCTCIFAADSFKQLDKLRMWLGEEENRRYIAEEDEMYRVVKELETRSVGLRASGIFIVTYASLWNMLTTAITYFIICLQSLHEAESDVTI